MRIAHSVDPGCWCPWGLEPVLRRLKAARGNNVETVIAGGCVFDDIDDRLVPPRWIDEAP